MTLFIDTMLLLSALIMCLIGCVLLALSQQRNWREVLSDRKAEPPRIAWAGWSLVLLALVPCVVRDGGSFSALLWPLVFACGAMATAMILTYCPNLLKPIALALRIRG
ncbi:MAG: DUF3325 domain-containing protein [Pseudomonadota bacterium]